MPFPAQTPRAFTRQNVELITPGQNGCYGIMKNGRVVYIVKGDIRTRLLAHVDGDNPRISRLYPDQWVDVVTADMDNEEKRLIVEFNPVCNQRLG